MMISFRGIFARNSCAVVAATLLLLGVGHSSSAAAAAGAEWESSDVAGPSNPCTNGAYGASATFVDPYWLQGKTQAQIVSLLSEQKAAGITTVILQWTGYRYKSGAVATTYDPTASTGFSKLNSTATSYFAAAADVGVSTWAGLLVAPNVFAENGAATNEELLEDIAGQTTKLASDVWSRFGGQIDGWYLPIEPGRSTIATAETAQKQGEWMSSITEALDGIAPGVPVMSSPAVPTGGVSPREFVDRFEPVMQRAGVDVWNMQDGYGWTAWSPATNTAMITHAQTAASRYGATVWADIYTPYGADGAPTIKPENLQADLLSVGATGAPITLFTFSRAFNPDPSLPGWEARNAQLEAYLNYCRD